MKELLIDEIRKEFNKHLMNKTNWGRNEVKFIFEQSISVASIKVFDAKEQGSLLDK